MAYTIIDVERKLGIASRTLRFWASKGLFDNLERDKNGVLYFSEKGLEQVIWTEYLRKGGMSIAQIKEYNHILQKGPTKENLQKRRDIIKKQLESVSEEIEILKQIVTMLEDKIAFTEEWIKRGKKPETSKYKCLADMQKVAKTALNRR